jgi:hypothetical protein
MAIVRLTEAEVAGPTRQLRDQLANHFFQADAPVPPRQLADLRSNRAKALSAMHRPIVGHDPLDPTPWPANRASARSGKPVAVSLRSSAKISP